MTLAEYLAQKPAEYASVGSVPLTGDESEVNVFWSGPMLVVQMTLPLNPVFHASYFVWNRNGVLWTTTGRKGPSCFRLTAYPLLDRPLIPMNPDKQPAL